MDDDDYYYTLMLTLRLQAAFTGGEISVNQYLNKMADVNSSTLHGFLIDVTREVRKDDDKMYWLTPTLTVLERTEKEGYPVTNTEIEVTSRGGRFRLIVLVSEQLECKLQIKHVQLHYDGPLPAHQRCVFQVGNTDSGFFLKNHLRRLSPELRVEAVKLLGGIAPHRLDESMCPNHPIGWKPSNEARLEMTQESWDLLTLAMFGLRND